MIFDPDVFKWNILMILYLSNGEDCISETEDKCKY